MNTKAASVFSKIILSDKKINIKLLGDSITHGVGGTGFVQNGEPIVAGFARNPDGYCWAKQFKEQKWEQKPVVNSVVPSLVNKYRYSLYKKRNNRRLFPNRIMSKTTFLADRVLAGPSRLRKQKRALRSRRLSICNETILILEILLGSS